MHTGNGGSLIWNILTNIFKRCGVDSAELRTDLDYVKPLIKLFEKQMTKISKYITGLLILLSFILFCKGTGC